MTVNWSSHPDLDRPVLVAAFEGWNDAGNAASDAVRFLARSASAVDLATLDPQEWLDFQAARPVVTIADGVVRTTTWPSIRFLASPATVSGFGRDLLLLVGPEPNLRWPAFCAEVVGIARELDCSLALTLGALLADVPHTRAISVTGTASDPETVASLGLTRSHYEGPTGIVGVLSDALRAAGLPSASLWASVPHYVATPPNPRATHALLERLAGLVGVNLPLRSLEIAGAAWVRQVDEVAAGDDDIARYVRELEARHDAALEDEEPDDDEDDEEPELGELREEDLPTGDSLAADFEQFLRDQNDDE
jgi:predicted ATP-grasp superfamily ATP-dependent carboligase